MCRCIAFTMDLISQPHSKCRCTQYLLFSYLQDTVIRCQDHIVVTSLPRAESPVRNTCSGIRSYRLLGTLSCPELLLWLIGLCLFITNHVTCSISREAIRTAQFDSSQLTPNQGISHLELLFNQSSNTSSCPWIQLFLSITFPAFYYSLFQGQSLHLYYP